MKNNFIPADQYPAKEISYILKQLALAVRPGIATGALAKMAEILILEVGATSFNKGYNPQWDNKNPFPSVLCTSVNSVIAHGIPGEYVLKEGDLINLDLGIVKNGIVADAGLSLGVGEISNRNERLLWNAKKALYEGIGEVKAGAKVLDIAYATSRRAVQNGFVINRHFTGHGIGKKMHELPRIFHDIHAMSDTLQMDVQLEEGQVICIEPMLTFKDMEGYQLPDSWGRATRDNQNSAMFEHMVEVKKDGYKILTDHISL